MSLRDPDDAAGGPGGPRPPVVTALVWLAALSPLCFALVTGQAWEDFFISFRHSTHLVDGQGLTYQAGETIQGFSSPFAVLLGSLAYLVTGSGSTDGALWVLRLLGLAAAALTAWFLYGTLAADGRARSWAVPAALLLFALESKSVAFTANGMETPFFVMFLAGALWSMREEITRPLTTGLFWAGLMWSRPDGCVYIALLGLAYFLIPPRSPGARVSALVRGVGVCALVYLPWFLFAWAYYGSPIPQTVLAKSSGYAGFAGAWETLRDLPTLWYLTFLPPYAQKGGWDLFKPLGVLLGMVGTLMWLVPGTAARARRASFVALGALVYLGLIRLNSPWYFPPIFALTLPAIGDALHRVGGLLPDRRAARRLAAGAALLTLGGSFAFLWVDYARLARLTTEFNEERNRKAIGLWLRSNAREGDRVFLECPGIIGYYSDLKMLDYPGLVSPEVTAVTRRKGRGIARAGLALESEWMVLRPHEFRLLKTIGEEDFQRKYRIARVFDQSSELAARLPGRRGVLYDSTFIVLQRRDRALPPAGDAPPDD